MAFVWYFTQQSQHSRAEGDSRELKSSLGYIEKHIKKKNIQIKELTHST